MCDYVNFQSIFKDCCTKVSRLYYQMKEYNELWPFPEIIINFTKTFVWQVLPFYPVLRFTDIITNFIKLLRFFRSCPRTPWIPKGLMLMLSDYMSHNNGKHCLTSTVIEHTNNYGTGTTAPSYGTDHSRSKLRVLIISRVKEALLGKKVRFFNLNNGNKLQAHGGLYHGFKEISQNWNQAGDEFVFEIDREWRLGGRWWKKNCTVNRYR